MADLVSKVNLVKRMLADPQLTPADKVVGTAYVVVFHNTKTGKLNPSREKVAAATRIHPRTVRNSTARLDALGYITILLDENGERNKGGRNRRNKYVLNFDAGQTVARSHSLEKGRVARVPQKGGEGCTKRVARGHTHRTHKKNAGKEHMNNARARVECEFDTFWNAYPHRVGRVVAAKAFEYARRVVSLETILEGVRRYVEAKPPERNWCNPSTWLNQGRWDDEPASTDAPRRRSSDLEFVDKLLAELEADKVDGLTVEGQFEVIEGGR